MKKTFLILLMSIAGSIAAAAQEYWRPSAELVERARQEPVIREHIERYISFRRSIESEKSLLDIHYTIQPDGIHISQTLKYDKYSNMQDFILPRLSNPSFASHWIRKSTAAIISADSAMPG